MKINIENIKKDFSNIFKMGYDGDLTNNTKTSLHVFGWTFIICIWWILSNVITSSVFPNPIDVIKSFVPLWNEKYLLYNSFYSIGVNLLGYLIAVAIAIPIGFIMGLFPVLKYSMNKVIDSIRFIPIPVVTGIFVTLFGLTIWLKVNFLAFGIFVYLLPVVVQRIDEVDKTLKQTIWTLGANKWQRFTKVYFPAVMSRISDDIRVLVAISWTYIVVAEMMNQTGGLGNLATLARQETRYDMLYAIMIEILAIGYIQDKLLLGLDKNIFKYKYV